MITETQQTLLDSACEIPGKVQEIFLLAVEMGDETTVDHIISNHTDQLDDEICAMIVCWLAKH